MSKAIRGLQEAACRSLVIVDERRSPNTCTMDALRRLLGSTPAQEAPPPIETDDIYPVHLLDGSKTLRGIVVTWTLRFNDVLDPNALHDSLSTLLDIGDWRKLGGRLRLKVGITRF